MVVENWPPKGIKWYYSDKWTAIAHGDCREILPQLDVKVDLVLTDPPYGIDMSQGFEGFGGFGEPIARRQYPDTWDGKRPSRETLNVILDCSSKVIIFGGNYLADLLPQSTHWLVWDKLNTMPTFGDCELLWTSLKRKSVKKYTYEWNGLLGKEGYRYHPTQKPDKLMSQLIVDYSDKGNLILDPFLGSGTTCFCAKKLNRYSIGIEIEEKYCEIAAKRCCQEVMELV